MPKLCQVHLWFLNVLVIDILFTFHPGHTREDDQNWPSWNIERSSIWNMTNIYRRKLDGNRQSKWSAMRGGSAGSTSFSLLKEAKLWWYQLRSGQNWTHFQDHLWNYAWNHLVSRIKVPRLTVSILEVQSSAEPEWQFAGVSCAVH